MCTCELGYVLVNNVCEGESLQRFACTQLLYVSILADLHMYYVGRLIASYVCICCSLSVCSIQFIVIIQILMSAVEPMTVSKSVLTLKDRLSVLVSRASHQMLMERDAIVRYSCFVLIFRLNSNRAFQRGLCVVFIPAPTLVLQLRGRRSVSALWDWSQLQAVSQTAQVSYLFYT